LDVGFQVDWTTERRIFIHPKELLFLGSFDFPRIVPNQNRHHKFKGF